MTDKERIIINNVDVSKCDFYDKDKKYCLALKMNPKGFKNPSCFSGDFQQCIQDSKTCRNTFCHNNHNCYYKQLARKREECKALKSEVKKLFNTKLELLLELDHYKRAYYGCQKPAKEKFVASIQLPTAEFIDDQYHKTLKEIQTLTKINCEEICGRKFEDCNDTSCFSARLLDIINQAMERIMNVNNKLDNDFKMTLKKDRALEKIEEILSHCVLTSNVEKILDIIKEAKG